MAKTSSAPRLLFSKTILQNVVGPELWSLLVGTIQQSDQTCHFQNKSDFRWILYLLSDEYLWSHYVTNVDIVTYWSYVIYLIFIFIIHIILICLWNEINDTPYILPKNLGKPYFFSNFLHEGAHKYLVGCDFKTICEIWIMTIWSFNWKV